MALFGALGGGPLRLNHDFKFHMVSWIDTWAMVDLPDEIWLHIATFLTASDSWRLRSMNRSFLGIALDNRYRVVVIPSSTYETKDFALQFQRLGCVESTISLNHVNF